MKKKFKELISFVKELQDNWQEMGAIVPSSKRLAKKMIFPMQKFIGSKHPKRILEVGAGTGVMTSEIIKHMNPEDRLIIYEMNDKFAEILASRITKEWKYKRIKLYVKPFPEGIENDKFDFALCSLPFNNFTNSGVKLCLDAFNKILSGGGYLTFFEYCFIRKARITLSDKDKSMRLKRIEATIKKYLNSNKLERETVIMNIPPAWVHTLYFP